MNTQTRTFHGTQPILHPSQLGEGMAVRAHNCRLESGKLVPLRNPSVVSAGSGMRVYLENGLASVADAKTLYCWKHGTRDRGTVVDFLAFPGVVDIVEGNIADDEYDRLFVTGDTGVDFTDADGNTISNTPCVYLYSRQSESIVRHTICKATMPAPVVSADEPSEEKTIYYVHFFASWVDSLGYESGLSNASTVDGATVPLEVNSGQTIAFAAMNIPSAASKIYVYVSSAGTSESTDGIQFFAEVGAAEAREGFSRTYVPENIGEKEPGIESAPLDLMGVKAVSGGYYAGFSPSSPHTVMFSDIGIVTSWPIAYRYDVKDNVVALATTSNSVFALTDGWPWVISGTAPETMSVAKLAGPAACVSRRGVCVHKNSCYYVGNDGLMAITNSADSGTVCTNITRNIFSTEQWRAKNPKSCVMAQHRDALYLFFSADDGTPLESLRIGLADGANAVTTHDENAVCACVDNRTDEMYFIRRKLTGE